MNNLLSCPEWEEKLAMTNPEDLSDVDLALLTTHLASCPGCASARAASVETDLILQRLPPIEPLAELPPQLVQMWEGQDASDNSWEKVPVGSGQQGYSMGLWRWLQAIVDLVTGFTRSAHWLSTEQRALPPRLARRGHFVGALVMIVLFALASLASSSPFLPVGAQNPQFPVIRKVDIDATQALAATDVRPTYMMALHDSLNDNSKGYGWDTYSYTTAACMFIDEAYHDTILTTGQTNIGLASATNFVDFAFQVDMSILRGDGGGIVFRANEVTHGFYYFAIFQDGSYTLRLHTVRLSHSLHQEMVVSQGKSDTIRTGLGQSNVIAVLAQNDSFSLYINDEWISNVTDTASRYGAIGVVAVSSEASTEVAFSNAKVWTFSDSP